MAIYQFVIELIPHSWVIKNKNSSIDFLFNEDGYDTSIAWQLDCKATQVESLISQFHILSRKKSWHQNLMFWGDEEFHDIQLWVKDGNVESLKIRIDLRKNIAALKNKIISLCDKLACDIFVPEMKQIIKPELDLFNEIILQSSAVKFIEDPEKFLDNMT